MLLDGEQCVYALCRPPGHHAGPDFFGGYCYLNNAAVAADILARAAAPVAIVDLDYHHGNGTQAIFYERADVWYGSVHVDPTNTYPYYAGYADETGSGEGEGANLNIPLAEGAGEDAYLAAVGRLLEPAAAADASALVVSVGFDAWTGDPFSTFGLTADGYAEIGQRIRARGLPTLLVQEGGYQVTGLGQLACAFVGPFA
jgi:acetoin utilization deacetylase AcuC-like enzyme